MSLLPRIQETERLACGLFESGLITFSDSIPTSDAQTLFEVQKLVITALFGFALGVAGNVITFFLLNRDRHIRELERQTKKMTFWKSYHEMREKLADAALTPRQAEMLERQFREDMQNISDAALGWKRRARSFAFGLALFGSMTALGLGMPYLARFINLGDYAGMPRGSVQRIVISWMGQAAVFWIAWQFIFIPIRNSTERMYLEIVRKNSGQFNIWLLGKHIFQSAFGF